MRNVIVMGERLGYLAGLDNFCWPVPVLSPSTPDGPYKLAQLVRVSQALYGYCMARGMVRACHDCSDGGFAQHRQAFCEALRPGAIGEMGTVLPTAQFVIVGLQGNVIVNSDVATLKEAWQRPLRW